MARRHALNAFVGFAWVLLACCGRRGPVDTGGPLELSDPVESTDVLVVGAGAAGLAAAIHADLAGADVIVLERDQEVGGAALHADLMLFSGTPVQEAEGVADSPERLLAEWPNFTGGDPEDEWVVQFAEDNVPEVYDWLVDFGVEFTLFNEAFFAAGETRRAHTLVEGTTRPLTALKERVDDDWLRLQTVAAQLVTRDGRVVGVQFEALETGETGWIEATCVVMATGGFLRDHDRVSEARPELAEVDLWHGSAVGADGSGLGMVEAVGGTTERLDLVALYLHGTADPRAGSEGEEVTVSRLNEGLWINAEGERFFDETEANSFRPGEEAVLQPAAVTWLVLDSSRSIEFTDPYRQTNEKGDVWLDDVIASGFAAEAETLGELGDAIGVAGDALEATVTAFNAYASGDVKSDPWRSGVANGTPLTVEPYVAVRLVPVTAKAFGGVDVDLNGRVVSAHGHTIPGLYAAGELTGMAGGSLVGDRGFAGSLSAVILSAKIAGDAAAAEALGSGR